MTFFEDWMSGTPLYGCMHDFSAQATVLGYALEASDWRISGALDLTKYTSDYY